MLHRVRGDRKIVERCERVEQSDYHNELQIIKDVQIFDFGKFRITDIKCIEKAQKAAFLIKELHSLVNQED